MSNINSQAKYSHSSQKVGTGSWLLFFILFILVLIFVILYFSEIKQELKLLVKVHPLWLIAAILTQILTYYFTSHIYQLLLHAQELPSPGLWELFKATVVSLFISQTVPSAGISGNAYIFNFLVKYNIRVTSIISLILAELLASYAAMEFIIILLLLSALVIHEGEVFIFTLMAGIAAYIFFGILVTLTGKKASLDRIFEKVEKIKFLKNLFEQIHLKGSEKGVSNEDVHLLTFLKKRKLQVLKVTLFHVLVIIADAATLYTLFYGLGMPVSPYLVLLGLVSTRIVSLIPLLPGSVFLYESSMTFFFVSLGVPLSVAIIVTLLFRLLSYWLPMPIGLFLYRRWLSNSPSIVY